MDINGLLLIMIFALSGGLVVYFIVRWYNGDYDEDNRVKEKDYLVYRKDLDDEELNHMSAMKYLKSDEFKLIHHKALEGDDKFQLIAGLNMLSFVNLDGDTSADLLYHEGIKWIRNSAGQGNDEAKFHLAKFEYQENIKNTIDEELKVEPVKEEVVNFAKDLDTSPEFDNKNIGINF